MSPTFAVKFLKGNSKYSKISTFSLSTLTWKLYENIFTDKKSEILTNI